MTQSDNGDGTVTDAATGLMWAKADSGETMDWPTAPCCAQSMNAESYHGQSDWRMPNVKELQGLVDYSRSPDTTNSAAIDPVFKSTEITNEPGEPDFPVYWSSTTHMNFTDAPATFGAYVSFGQAMGYRRDTWIDVQGAGEQRSDPNTGDPGEYPQGNGPQGNAIRILNYVRVVRDAE